MLKMNFFVINTNELVSSFSHIGLWVFALAYGQFSSSKCQHGMEHEGLWKLSFFGFALIL